MQNYIIYFQHDSADDKFDGTWPVNVVIYYDGNVTYTPPAMIKSKNPIIYLIYHLKKENNFKKSNYFDSIKQFNLENHISSLVPIKMIESIYLARQLMNSLTRPTAYINLKIKKLL